MNHLMKIDDEYQNHEKLVVFVDGLYNLDVDAGKNEGIRVENIEKAIKIKLITDKYRIPLIATGELRKKMKGESRSTKPTMHDVMETGRYAYNANVIWLLYADDPDTVNQPYQILSLEYAKNKLSDFKGIQSVDFTRSTGTIKEINLPTQPKGSLFADLGGEIE